jgi:hypothetical protein
VLRSPPRSTGSVLEDTGLSFRQLPAAGTVSPRRCQAVSISAGTVVFKIITAPCDVMTSNLVRTGRRSDDVIMQVSRSQDGPLLRWL